MKRQLVLRSAMAASVLAAWQLWLFPVLSEWLEMPATWFVRRITGWVFPPVPNEDYTLAHAPVLGPPVFLFNAIALLPFVVAFICSFPSDRRLLRTWDAIVFAVGLISVLVGGGIVGCAVLFPNDDPPISQQYYLFSTFVPMLIAGAVTSFGSYRMLRTIRLGEERAAHQS